ncbi:MAG: hypothetical protein K5879_06900 [Lachnospiraceae bacterium]|nr:hypothetical protein [Lachnospiraceae bacterium]
MNTDFHYYATYCTAVLAGYSHEEACEICYSAQFVDFCSKTFLSSIKGPLSAATSQLAVELVEQKTDILGLQDITRIWSSFHFLPYDLHAKKKHCSRIYLNKYRLICNSNGKLVADTVNLAKNKTLQAVGIAMHVTADTWAHKYFAGTPSMVINNTDRFFYEVLPEGDSYSVRQLKFSHNPGAKDDPENGVYVNSLYQTSENTVMNLGHGRAGHLPDYSFIRYKYLPAWADYEEVLKDNPSDYLHAFAQLVYAMRYIRGEVENFELNTYAWDIIEPYRGEIETILEKRQTDDAADWKALGEKISGKTIPDFDIDRYKEEYKTASKEEKNNTFLGKFILGALAQKSMVTGKIYKSGNPIAGVSVDYKKNGFAGIKDYMKLIEYANGGKDDE